jgi:hypothetical protein
LPPKQSEKLPGMAFCGPVFVDERFDRLANSLPHGPSLVMVSSFWMMRFFLLLRAFRGAFSHRSLSLGYSANLQDRQKFVQEQGDRSAGLRNREEKIILVTSDVTTKKQKKGRRPMKTQTDNYISAFGAAPAADRLTTFAQNLQAISDAAGEIKAQLSRYADAEDNVTLKRQAEALRAWMDINSEGLNVAAHVAQLGPVWAEEIKGRLEAAARDLRLVQQESNDSRTDPEGVTDILQVWSDVNNVLESMEELYKPAIAPPPGAGKLVEPVQAYVR